MDQACSKEEIASNQKKDRNWIYQRPPSWKKDRCSSHRRPLYGTPITRCINSSSLAFSSGKTTICMALSHIRSFLHRTLVLKKKKQSPYSSITATPASKGSIKNTQQRCSIQNS